MALLISLSSCDPALFSQRLPPRPPGEEGEQQQVATLAMAALRPHFAAL